MTVISGRSCFRNPPNSDMDWRICKRLTVCRCQLRPLPLVQRCIETTPGLLLSGRESEFKSEDPGFDSLAVQGDKEVCFNILRVNSIDKSDREITVLLKKRVLGLQAVVEGRQRWRNGKDLLLFIVLDPPSCVRDASHIHLSSKSMHVPHRRWHGHTIYCVRKSLKVG